VEPYLTRHARNRMRLYDIPEAVVRDVLAKPDEILSGDSGYQHAWGRGGGEQWLRITFKDEGDRRIIITVTPKRKKPGG